MNHSSRRAGWRRSLTGAALVALMAATSTALGMGNVPAMSMAEVADKASAESKAQQVIEHLPDGRVRMQDLQTLVEPEATTIRRSLESFSVDPENTRRSISTPAGSTGNASLVGEAAADRSEQTARGRAKSEILVPFAGALQVAAGGAHSCALATSGEVRCWGNNGSGQLGDDSTTNRWTPVTVSDLTGATAIAAGTSHACALVAGGEVRCWGGNFSGQLGDNSTTQRLTPVAVSGLTGATAIAAGGNHTCALVAGGEVRCWGGNFSGQLGDNSTTQRLTPVAVSGLTGATAIAAGSNHTCALVAGGEARCWGFNGFGQLGDDSITNRLTPVAVSGLTGATAIAAGDNHTCALVAGGEVRCWGFNSGGQLGDSSTTNRLTPVAVSGLTSATAIAAGTSRTCAALAGGEGRCWGLNNFGQLGDNSTTQRLTPVAVSGLIGATAIAAGSNHTCTVVAGGEVRCWGANNVGQLGDNSTTNRQTPVGVIGLTGATAIAAGTAHTCALVAGGEARCWGANSVGQLGDNGTTERLTPVAVSGLIGATAIAAGNAHTCALAAGGEVRCWGRNSEGQLGDNSTTQRLAPVAVSGLTGATAIAAGLFHTCALVAGGEVRCWGFNFNGQLGDNSTAQRLTPVAVSGLSGATAIAAGNDYTCVLVAGGEVRCWGANSTGQLGDNSMTNRLTPVAVSGLTGATAIAAGGAHTCALVAGGEVLCWGNNGSGQLADNSVIRRLTPGAVIGLTGATAIDGGTNHTCTLVAGGEARCWGNNINGQLGDNSTTQRFRPAVVDGLTGATAIVASQTHTCALVGGGAVRCWGESTNGRLGDGTSSARSLPVTVLVALQSQTLTFGSAPMVVVGGTGTVSATGGGSDNPVVFSSQTTGVCTVSGSTVTGVSEGTCTIAANQAGNGSFAAAPEVTQSFAVINAPIDAVNDSGTVANGASGGVAVADVLLNDTLNAAAATQASVTLTQLSTSHPNITLNPATGAVAVAAATPAGTYTLTYRICEQLNPTNCDDATATVTVGAAVIDAVNDSGTVANGASGGVAVADVLLNDTLNAAAATQASVTLTQLSTSNPNVTLNPATGAVAVAAATPVGSYTLTYRICEQLNPTNCDTAIATVTVGAAVIDAVNDSGTVANGASGGIAVADVLLNDTLNAAPATLASVTLTQLSTSNPNITLNPATGAVAVAAATPAGTYTLTYRICEQLNPTNCDDATAAVTVGAAVIDAVNDSGTVANGASGGTAVADVLLNDTLNAAPATLASVTLTQLSTSNPNITLNLATGAVAVAAATPAGTYTLTYQICEQLNPTNCDNATATVTVGAAPIDAVDEDYTGTQVNGASGGALPTVLVNDTLNGGAATVGEGGNVTLTPGAAPTPAAGSIAMNADGTITIAAGTTAGVYTYAYTICEVLNPTNCDTATVTVNVGAAIIDAVNDSGTVANGAAGGTAVADVLLNDTLNAAAATLASVTLTQLSTSHPNVTLNPASGAVAVAAATPAGTYTLTYRICEQLNPTNCDNATATVTVGAAVIDAVNDSGTVANGASGGTAVADVLLNDTLNAAPATLASVTLTQLSTSNPNVTLNPATGAVSVAAATPVGSYTLTYRICEQLNPTNCDTAIATVTVGAAVIDAVNDSGTVANGAAGGTAVANVLVNDTLNDAAATLASVTLTQLSTSNPNVTLNPATGEVSAAAATPVGSYTLTYRICEQLNPTNCDNATVSVTVNALPPTTADSSVTVGYNAAATGVPLTLGGGAATSLTVVTPPAKGTANVSGTTITYQPNAGFAGPDSFTYTATNSGGTSAPATVNITVQNPVITITPSGGLSATVASPYTQTFGFDGGAPPWSEYQVTNLPAGLSITGTTTNTLTIGGTPTQAGSFTLNVSATDSSTGNGPFTVGQAFGLTVDAVVPGAPSIGTATAGDGEASISFGEPAFTGGAPVTGYTVTSIPDGLTGTGVGSPITVVGLSNGVAYTFTVSATNSAGTGAASEASNAVTPRGPQAALTALATPSTVAFGATSALSTSGGSGGGEVSYAITAGAAFCSLSGSTLTATAIGTCTVTATKAAEGAFNAATATVEVTVVRAEQAALTATASPSSVAFNGTSTLATTGGSGTGAVSFAVTAGTEFCSVSGTTLTGTGVGTCTVTATKAADANFNAATATVEVTVGRAEQAPLTATATPASIVFNGTSALEATGGSGTGAVSFAVTAGGEFCWISGATLTGTGVGTCTVTATKAADVNFNAATSTVEVTVGRAEQAALTATASPSSIAFGGTSTLGTTGGSGTGAVSYAISAGSEFCSISGTTLTGTGVGTCTVTATKAADANFNAATSMVDVTVGRADQAPLTATATPASIVFNGTSTLATTGGSGTGAVSFAVTAGSDFCSITGTTLTGTGVGTCTVTATKAADDNFNAASATVDVTVSRADQAPLNATATPASIVFNGSSTLATTGGSGTGAVSYAVTAGTEFCSISSTTLTGIGVGTCTVTATKAADANFNAATATVSVTVVRANQAPLSVTATPSAIPLTRTTALAAAGGSGSGEVSFAVTAGAANCTISGSTLTGTGVGACTVVATKAGDAQFNPASAQATVEVQAATDLEISKDDGTQYALPQGTVLYEILVANAGPLDVEGARLRDVLPAGLADALWTCTPLQLASCPQAAGEGGIDQTLTLPVNGVLRYLLSARVTAPLGSTLTNTATIDAPTGVIELQPSDNSASDSNLVVPEGLFGNGFEAARNRISVPVWAR